MARPQIVCYVDRVNGVSGNRRAVADAEVTFTDKDSAAAFSVYAADTGGSALAPPFETNSEGLVVHSSSDTLYADQPRQAVVTATKDSWEKEIELPLIQGSDLGGRELGYAQITATSPNFSTAGSDIAGLSVTVNVGVRPILVRFFTSGVTTASAGQYILLSIWEGATQLQASAVAPGQTNDFVHVYGEVRLAPSAGSHTYKVRGVTETGNATVLAIPTQPAFIQVVEC